MQARIQRFGVCPLNLLRMIAVQSRRRLTVLVPALCLSGCLGFTLDQEPVVGNGRTVRTADSTCVYLDPENARHLVAGCESASGYRVLLSGVTQHYDKRLFQNRMRDQLQRFLRGSLYGAVPAPEAKVQVWLEAPILQPESARFVAVVDGPAGVFAVPFGLNQQVWQIDEADVAWLGRASYPSQGARRSDLLTLFAQPTVDAQQLQTFLAHSGVLAMKTAGGQNVTRELRGEGTVLQWHVRPFAAPAVARLLRQTPEYRVILAAMEIPVAGGREAYTAPVFSFPLQSPAIAKTAE